MPTQPHYRRGVVLNLAHFDFDIVSDFDIRISDFSLSARPSCPVCHEFMSQLCKTNPILQTTKIPQHLMPHRFTAISCSAPRPKNKPNQTQSPRPLLRRERIQNLGAKRISRFIGPASKIENPVSRIKHLPHLTTESWRYCAKQTQFPQSQNQRNPLCRKGLRK